MHLSCLVLILTLIVSAGNLIYTYQVNDGLNIDCRETKDCTINIPLVAIVVLSGLYVVLHTLVYLLFPGNKVMTDLVTYLLLIPAGISLGVTNYLYGPMTGIKDQDNQLANTILNYSAGGLSLLGGVLGLLL